MRLPNGFGSVYKLSGNRRNPWVARKTTGYTFDLENQKSHPIYKFIGYYPTRKEALTALTEYNQNPYDLEASKITFEELYGKWSEVHFAKISESNIKGYKASYKCCSSIYPMHVKDIKLDHLQRVMDDSGKNTPTLKKMKNLFGLMWDYAVIHEIVSPDKREMIRYLDINKAGNPNAIDRTPFSKKEIELLWNSVDSNSYISVILIMIYSGVRIGELLELKKEDVHIQDKWFYIRKAKTDSGIREVPIADKVLPFFQYWYNVNESEYLISTPDSKPFKYRNYRDSYWNPIMEELGMNHKPHDTRHTCVSLLTEKKADERIIKKIVGHKGQGVTQSVYTHLDLDSKLEAINLI
ncbi:MAG: site-specific integrase [Peptococcaceae bacterium]|nr:site-specific integrase [Peptococcaceae bacterium]